jgi:ATP-dependent protease ClpP protease subunit
MMTRPFRTTRRIANLRRGRNDWYRIANATATEAAQVHIYDEIGFFGVTASDLAEDLAGVTGNLDVHMNCPGGDVFEAVTIYNALKNHQQGIVSVYIDGLAASAASYIAQAADPGNLFIAKNASMMIHDAFGMGIGNAGDMRKLADLLDEQSENIASIYADRSGRPADEFRQAMLTETWYVGQKAVDAGLADQVTADREISNSWDLSVFSGPGPPIPQALVDDTQKIDLAGLDFDPDLFLSLLKEAK